MWVTYQSPLAVFRPLAPPSVDVLPAAAEAKLEVNGEGIIMFLKGQVFEQKISKCSRLSKMYSHERLGGEPRSWVSFVVG